MKPPKAAAAIVGHARREPVEEQDPGRKREGAGRPGPLRVPGSRAAGIAQRIGWLLAGLVLLLAVVLFVASRAGPQSAPPGPPIASALPSWGPLTLAQVARSAAAAAGEPHPTNAFWLLTRRSLAVAYITGQPEASAEADYLVGMHGMFSLRPGPTTLAGSRQVGSLMLVLVRGFDGRVVGRWVGNRNLTGLRSLGIPHTLSLGLGL